MPKPIKPAHYIGQELIFLYQYPEDLGPARGEVVKVESFAYQEEMKTIMLELEGYLPCYPTNYFIDRQEYNRLMLAVPKRAYSKAIQSPKP